MGALICTLCGLGIGFAWLDHQAGALALCIIGLLLGTGLCLWKDIDGI
jgi:hypothetical protein